MTASHAAGGAPPVDLAVQPPGRPDSGTTGTDTGEPDYIAPGDDAGAGERPGLSQESVKGLVLVATNLLHLGLAAKYPERPDIARLDDADADRIAGALISMAGRNAGLRAVLERSDLAVLVVVLGGYGGNITNDILQATRERRADDGSGEGNGIHGRTDGVVGRVDGGSGERDGSGGAIGGLPGPDNRGGR
jgi:hypothetical protein